jgi:cytoskeletal protein CcmA (bactofilin family)
MAEDNFFKHMFKKEDGIGGNETIIANGVKVEGDFTSPGNVRIEGVVIGSVKAEGDLAVTETATIEANVAAANAVVAGEIKGDVAAAEKLDLLATAKIRGNISCRTLAVEAGAVISGNCQVAQEKTAVRERAREAKVAVEEA